MTTRRISIHDYPEHLNPFNEFYNDGADIGNRSKYHTWSSVGKHKIKHALLDKPRSAMSPTKLVRKLSIIKTIAIDRFSPSKSKTKHRAVESTPVTPLPKRDEPFIIISPKQKEKMRRLALEAALIHEKENGSQASNADPNSNIENLTLPVRRKLSLQEETAHVDDTKGDKTSSSPEQSEHSNSSSGARRCRSHKKRIAPPPPQYQPDVIRDIDISSSLDDSERSVSPDESITQILEQDVSVHSDEHIVTHKHDES